MRLEGGRSSGVMASSGREARARHAQKDDPMGTRGKDDSVYTRTRPAERPREDPRCRPPAWGSRPPGPDDSLCAFAVVALAKRHGPRGPRGRARGRARRHADRFV